MRLLGFAIVALSPCLACTDDNPCPPRVVTSDVACSTDEDCSEEGFNTLSCLNGRCQRPCLRDADCEIAAFNAEDHPEECVRSGMQPPTAVCEAQICRVGCPDVPCAADEVCQAGRCALDYQGFELDGRDFVNLSILGWNSIERPVENTRMSVAFEGVAGCSLGDDNCAGAASENARFALVARQPTPPKGTSTTDFTCRPCRCCLECLATPFEVNDPPPPVQLSSCPFERTAPAPITCHDPTPSHCVDVCNACDACPDAPPDRLGQRLEPCERVVALKTCSSCPACDALLPGCTASECPVCAAMPTSRECGDCVRDNCQSRPECQDCVVCEDSLTCDPNDANCIQQGLTCQSLGADGCFFTPVSYRDEQLDDHEQSLVSPEIDLSGVTGGVVLQFDYVSFDIGDRYRPGIQGQDPLTWPEEPQEVLLQFCSSGCNSSASWVTAMGASGQPVLFPPVGRRNNGLLVGSQTRLDWNNGRIQVPIPPERLVAGFRYRFIPRIGDDARLGLDAIYVRRAQ